MLLADAAGTDIAAVVGVVTGLLSAIATIVVAWATLRADVRHLGSRMDAHERRIDGGDGRTGIDGRLGSLERWRERVRGATTTRPLAHRSSPHVAADTDDDG